MRQVVQTWEMGFAEEVDLEGVVPTLGLASYADPEFAGNGAIGVRVVVDQEGRLKAFQEGFSGDRGDWLEDYLGPLVFYQGNLIPGHWVQGEEVYKYLGLEAEEISAEYLLLVATLPQVVDEEQKHVVLILSPTLELSKYMVRGDGELVKFKRVKIDSGIEGGDDLLNGFMEN